jgi:F-type H+-transporting ATPase subunit gamma
VAGELDAVEVIFAKFNNPLSTPPTLLPILPIRPPEEGVTGRRSVPNYILKPSAEAILEVVLPMYVQNQMYRALVETAASEHGARRTAMKSATDNAGEMIDYLRRTYNRARQAQITQEIAEIVGGAEALKG